MNKSNLDNFRPVSPTSLYSYAIGVPAQDFPYAGAGLTNTITVSSKPEVSTTESTQPPEVIVAKSSKSILKNPKNRAQVTKTPPAKLQNPQKASPAKPRLSRPPSRSTTPVNRVVKQKTVAFGLTTNLSDTLEKKKEPATNTLCTHRPKPYMTTTKEAEEITKQLKTLKEEFGNLKTKLEGENAELRKSLDEMLTKETKLSNLLTNLSSRLMDLEQKHDQSVGSNSPHVQEPDNKLVNTSAQTIGSAGDRKERDGNATARRKDVASAPVKAGGIQRDGGQTAPRKDFQQRSQAMIPYQQDSMAVNTIAERDVQIDNFLSFIKQKIREDPRFEERINRTVSLFGGSPGENLPQTLESRAPFREKENEVGSSYYGTKYTQKLTIHKEITTCSPDRPQLPSHVQRRTMGPVPSTNDENRYFVDDEYEEDDNVNYDQGGGGNFGHYAPNSSNFRRDKYRRN
ncbi:hypothetical protein Ddc_08557 [Ditylenchus destructor]|nr:hypothetical protein Ddc_08557 [Ditylenchus destructor]